MSCIQPIFHLRPKPRPPAVDGPGDHGPGRRLLGDRLDVGEGAVDGLVEAPEEGDGLEVLAAAVVVGDPLPRLAGVVEVEHGGHGVDAQAVGVVAVEPEEGAADEELADLVAAVVEDGALPVGVEALARVLVLVERGAVEAAQAVPVGGEVGGHPVQDDADAVLVEHVDEVHEVLGRAVAAGRREVADRLVAPRAVEGVLHDRQELDVGEAHVPDVFGEDGGHLAVGERAVALLRDAAPRAQVDLVDRDGGGEGVGRAAAGHPVGVAPAVVEVPDDGGRARGRLGVDAEGIGLLGAGAVRGGDGIFVERALGDARG